MTTPSVLRLERYAAVLRGFEDDEEISLEKFLLETKTISANQLQEDFRLLGLSVDPMINRRAAQWAVRHAIADARREGILDGLEGTVSPVEISNIEREMMGGVQGTLRRAEIREAAGEFIEQHPAYFIRALGRIERGKTPFWHQLLTAKALLERHRGQALVADEVGLGKTLIGLLVAFEVLERRADATILILTPANLVEQWLRECRRFFGLDLEKIPTAGAAELAAESVVLLSIDRAKGSNLAPSLLQRQWDLLIIDEAHEIRNQDTVRASFVYALDALNRAYLTATPVQNSGYDIYHVANSLRPGFFNVKAQFTSNYMLDDRSVRDPESLQARLADIMERRRRPEVAQEGFAFRRVETVFVEEWTEKEHEAYDDLFEMLRGTYRRNLGYAAPIRRSSGMEEHISQFVLVAMLVLREMCSHTRAALRTLDTALRARLQALAESIAEQAHHLEPRTGFVEGWGLTELDEFITRHGNDLDNPDAHAKARKLLELLRDRLATRPSVLVYVCFRQTLDTLVRLLEETLEGVAVIDFHGGLSSSEKKDRIDRFVQAANAGPACLVSTDAGGQGLNLQSANLVINYDYPWNPMKLEQRIGRVDRYGQEADVIQVINLVTMGTIERYVYDTLRTKLEVFEHVVGDLMSPLNVEDVLENRIMLGIGELILSSHSTEEMRERFDGLDERSLKGYMDRYERYTARSERWIGE